MHVQFDRIDIRELFRELVDRGFRPDQIAVRLACLYADLTSVNSLSNIDSVLLRRIIQRLESGSVHDLGWFVVNRWAWNLGELTMQSSWAV